MSSYMCVISFYVCIVFFVVAMSFFGLHFIIDIWVCGINIGGGMYFGSLACMGVAYVCIILL